MHPTYLGTISEIYKECFNIAIVQYIRVYTYKALLDLCTTPKALPCEWGRGSCKIPQSESTMHTCSNPLYLVIL